jgi:hypothetical protein
MVRAQKFPTPEVALTIVATCEECARLRERERLQTGAHAKPWRRPTQGARECVLVEMAPGPDGAAWYLCVPHWFEGLHPNDCRALGSGRVLEAEVLT